MTFIPTAPLLSRRQHVLGPAYRLFYEEPLSPVRGEDVWLHDADGRVYLDCYNNVPSVGHAHPRVVRALAEQAGVLNTHTRYLHPGVVDYAEHLTALFPAGLDTAMFTCTGSEANDLALRIAQAVTGRHGVIVTELAYHGVTLALAEMSPSLRPVCAAHVRTVPAPLTPDTDGTAAARFAADVREAARSLSATGHPLAALMVDTVFASDGILTGAAGVLSAGAEAIREAGGLFIADEVQGGFARTGRWWAFEREPGLVPDIVTLGKPMGGGHPLAGLVMQAALAEPFGRQQRYFNTFGGNTVSMAVGQAVLDVIEQEGLLERARSVGAYLREQLQSLAGRHTAIAEVRGLGLYLGVELTTPQGPATALTHWLVNELRRQGVLLSSCGRHANVLKIRPPLTFQRPHADRLVLALDEALATAAQSTEHKE
jgi:4-aminobutyrate aminotransferase-like enzyme